MIELAWQSILGMEEESDPFRWQRGGRPFLLSLVPYLTVAFGGVKQWQLTGLIILVSVVRTHPPLPFRGDFPDSRWRPDDSKRSWSTAKAPSRMGRSCWADKGGVLLGEIR